MSASRRHALDTLLLFAVLLAACRPVIAPLASMRPQSRTL